MSKIEKLWSGIPEPEPLRFPVRPAGRQTIDKLCALAPDRTAEFRAKHSKFFAHDEALALIAEYQAAAERQAKLDVVMRTNRQSDALAREELEKDLRPQPADPGLAEHLRIIREERELARRQQQIDFWGNKRAFANQALREVRGRGCNIGPNDSDSDLHSSPAEMAWR